MARVAFPPGLLALKFPVRDYLIDQKFECGICADEHKAGSPYVLVSDDAICKECFRTELRPKFIQALSDEDAYPVMWASEKLEPSDFPDFSQDELMTWQVRRAMYDIPLSKRLFCGHFYRNKNKEAGDHCQHEAIGKADYEAARRENVECGECRYCLGASNKEKVVTCDDCNGVSCGKCGLPLGFENDADHDCTTNAPASVLDGIDKTLIRGVDFQLCPSDTCQRAFGLQDGCNAVVCSRCRTPFCFICGVVARDGSRHWGVGMPCPHWGQPQTQQAIWDKVEDFHWPDPPFDVPDFGLPLQILHADVDDALKYRRKIEAMENKPSQQAIESGNLTVEEEAALIQMDMHHIMEANVGTGTVWHQGQQVLAHYGPWWVTELDSMRAGFHRHANFWEQILWPLSNICQWIIEWGPLCVPFDVQARFEAAIKPGAKDLKVYHDDVYWLGRDSNVIYDKFLPDYIEKINREDPAAWAEWGLDPQVAERWIPRIEAYSKQNVELAGLLRKQMGTNYPMPSVATLDIA